LTPIRVKRFNGAAGYNSDHHGAGADRTISEVIPKMTNDALLLKQ
jgi:hypothetical protein